MAISTEQAWAEMSGKLRGYFRRRVSDQHLADDLVQETFLRIHNGIHSLKDDERLAAWVYRIAHNTLLDHLRKGVASKEVLTDEIVVPEDPPESNYNKEVGDCLREMVQSLPSNYRKAVEMAELEGVSQREVGETAGDHAVGSEVTGSARARETQGATAGVLSCRTGPPQQRDGVSAARGLPDRLRAGAAGCARRSGETAERRVRMSPATPRAVSAAPSAYRTQIVFDVALWKAAVSASLK